MTLPMAQLLSIQVGKPVTYPPQNEDQKPWRSAIGKTPVLGPLWLGELCLAGDAQADLRVHGGPFRAVNVYPVEHYDAWRAIPGLAGMTNGAFGENFTTRGLLEDSVCIGDIYQVGEAQVEITQPRGPCFKLERRWRMAGLAQLAEDTTRIGWYFRARQTGTVQAGQDLTLLERPYPQWTIARVWELREHSRDINALRALAACTALSDGWGDMLRKQIKRLEA